MLRQCVANALSAATVAAKVFCALSLPLTLTLTLTLTLPLTLTLTPTTAAADTAAQPRLVRLAVTSPVDGSIVPCVPSWSRGSVPARCDPVEVRVDVFGAPTKQELKDTLLCLHVAPAAASKGPSCAAMGELMRSRVFTPMLAPEQEYRLGLCPGGAAWDASCIQVRFETGRHPVVAAGVAMDFPTGTIARLTWPSGGALVGSTVAVDTELRVLDTVSAVRMASRNLCVSLNGAAPLCQALGDGAGGFGAPRPFELAGLGDGRHEVFMCITAEGAPECREPVPVWRSPATAPLGPGGLDVAPMADRAMFSVGPPLVAPPGTDTLGLLAPTPAALGSWMHWLAANPRLQAPPEQVLLRLVTIVSPPPGSVALMDPGDYAVDVSSVLSHLPEELPRGLPALPARLTSRFAHQDLGAAVSAASRLCVLMDDELRPSALVAISNVPTHHCASVPGPHAVEAAAGVASLRLSDVQDGFHSLRVCWANDAGVCVHPLLASEPVPYYFTTSLRAVEGVSAGPHDAPTAAVKRHGEWVTGSLLMRINRQNDPPLRFLLPAVVTSDEAASVRGLYEGVRDLLTPDLRDEYVLPRDHWVVDRVRDRLLDGLRTAGLTPRRLSLEYAVVSGSDRGDGIVIHADNCRTTEVCVCVCVCSRARLHVFLPFAPPWVTDSIYALVPRTAYRALPSATRRYARGASR